MQACINGARPRGRPSLLPTAPDDVARAVAACRAASASSIHLHVRNVDGIETLAAADVAATLEATRTACPEIPLGLTTGAWILPDPEDRCRAIESWTVRPDFASLNWHERGADQVGEQLLAAGIAIEAGLWGDRCVDLWRRSPISAHNIRVLIELPGGIPEREFRETADRLVGKILDHQPDAAVLLHGEEDTTWWGVSYALEHGLQTRVGFEDTLLLPDGEPAADNAALVRAALSLLD